MQFQSVYVLVSWHSAALYHLEKGKVTQEFKDVPIVHLIWGQVIASYTTTTAASPSKLYLEKDCLRLGIIV